VSGLVLQPRSPPRETGIRDGPADRGCSERAVMICGDLGRGATGGAPRGTCESIRPDYGGVVPIHYCGVVSTSPHRADNRAAALWDGTTEATLPRDLTVSASPWSSSRSH